LKIAGAGGAEGLWDGARFDFMSKAASVTRGVDGDPTPVGTARDGVGMIRIIAATLLCLLNFSAPGCSLFHHGEPPQQKFMNALNRGNGAQASQVWLTMSAKDRSNLTHSIGFKPNIDKDDIGRALLKHQQEEEAKKNADDPDPMMSAGAYGETGSDQQVEISGFNGNPTAGGLSNLPLFDTQPSATTTEVGPQ
jgi:hypothetical protein